MIYLFINNKNNWKYYELDDYNDYYNDYIKEIDELALTSGNGEEYFIIGKIEIDDKDYWDCYD